MRTITNRPLRRFVTRTFVPNRKVRWAAVMVLGLARSPLAVMLVIAYHEALPHWGLALAVIELVRLTVNIKIGRIIFIQNLCTQTVA